MDIYERIWNLSKIRFLQSEARLWIVGNKAIEVILLIGAGLWGYFEFFYTGEFDVFKYWVSFKCNSTGQGFAVSQNNLGLMYLHGIGVTNDDTLAFMWLIAAASQGDAEASQNRDRVPIDKNSEIYKLIDAAGVGDSEAQGELASALKQGEGIQRDDDAADYWLHKAAEGGDSWAQTIYGIRLRTTGDPAKEQESVSWFLRAAEQGDIQARFNLALNQCGGIGTPVALNSGALNLLKCSLSGFEEARGAVEKIRPMISEASWHSIFDQIEWPNIRFILYPPAEGLFDNTAQLQETNDGSEDPERLKYEREMVDKIFLTPSDKGGSILDAAFNENVSIKETNVWRYFDTDSEKTLTTITIKLGDIRLSDDFPVYWKPSEESIKEVASLIGLFGFCADVRWDYFSPVY